MNDIYQEALQLAEHIADVDESPMELVKQLHRGGLLKGPSAVDITLSRDQAEHVYRAEQRRRQKLKEEHNRTWVQENIHASAEVIGGERIMRITLRTRDTTIEGLILGESDAEQIRDTLTAAINFIKEHKNG